MDTKEMENKILDIFKDVLPKLSDESLARILGFGEGIALQQKCEEEKKKKEN